MTSTSDEITNLRAALKAIAQQTKDVGSSLDAHIDCLSTIGALARRALKTPRASKVTEPDTLRLDWVLRCAHIQCSGAKGPPTIRTREDIDVRRLR